MPRIQQLVSLQHTNFKCSGQQSCFRRFHDQSWICSKGTLTGRYDKPGVRLCPELGVPKTGSFQYITYCGWLRNPAPVDRWFIPLSIRSYIMNQTMTGAFLMAGGLPPNHRTSSVELSSTSGSLGGVICAMAMVYGLWPSKSVGNIMGIWDHMKLPI